MPVDDEWWALRVLHWYAIETGWWHRYNQVSNFKNVYCADQYLLVMRQIFFILSSARNSIQNPVCVLNAVWSGSSRILLRIWVLYFFDDIQLQHLVLRSVLKMPAIVFRWWVAIVKMRKIRVVLAGRVVKEKGRIQCLRKGQEMTLQTRPPADFETPV